MIGGPMNALSTLPDSCLRAQPRLRRAPRRGAHRRLGAVEHSLPGQRDLGVDPLLTAGEVAELLQVTKAWVYAETRARRIPHVPLGRYVRYRRSAVLQWIGALEEASQRVRVGLREE
jgi:excisionase family DNA binding protein